MYLPVGVSESAECLTMITYGKEEVWFGTTQ